MERYTSGLYLNGSSIENAIAGGMARQAMPAGSGAKQEQQPQQEQVKLQPSLSCRSEQGQCGAGSFDEVISSWNAPLCGVWKDEEFTFAKQSSGRIR